MTMTKKDYELIAKAIKNKVNQAQVLEDYHFDVEEYEAGARQQFAERRLIELADNLATALKADNASFDYDLFMEACGIHGVVDHECHVGLFRQ